MKQPERPDRLDSWKAVAAYLDRSVRTVKRWESDEGLPVHRHMHRRQGTVYAFRSEIDAWLAERSQGSDLATVNRTEKIADGVLVLPFEHIGPDSGQAWLADGFSEALIADLSAIDALRVLSRTSSRTLRNRGQDARSIGRRHGVRYLIEGSCRSLESRVRISVRLIDVDVDASIWSRVFEGELSQAFDLQSCMASALAGTVSGAESRALERPGASGQVEDVATWQCLILARQQALTWRAEGLEKAVRQLESGLEHLGERASLLAALGRTWLQFRESALDLGPGPLERAHCCARRMESIAPGHPGRLQLRGWLEYCDGRVNQAIAALYEANRIQPNDPETLGLLINCLLISDRAAEARPLIAFLTSIDPLSPLTVCLPGWDRLLEGDFIAALPHYEAMHEMDPAHPMARLFLIWVRILAGRRLGLEALAVPDDQHLRDHPALKVARFLAGAADGDEQAERWLDEGVTRLAEASEMVARFLAEGYAMLGQHELALRWLHVAVQRGFAHLGFLERHDPLIRCLDGNAEFEQLLQNLRSRRGGEDAV